MSCRKPNKVFNQGFTLIEILVALAIIAIALAALIEASSSHTNSVAYLKQKSIAHWVAMNEITELQIKQSWPSIGKERKSTEMAGNEWYWLRDILETEAENRRGVSFTIYLDEDREQQITRLNGYLNRPRRTVIINRSSTGGSGSGSGQ